MVEYMKKYILLGLVFLTFLGRIVYLNYYKGEYYQRLLFSKTNNYVYGSSAPRGRIMDRNGVVLVDNKGIKTIYYTKLKSVKEKDEIEIAYKLASIINIKVDEEALKDFWLILNNHGDDLITDKEWQLYEERKIDEQEIKKLKLDRITEEELNNLSALDKKSATIYKLMNKGYSYDRKEIVRNISDEEYTMVMEENIPGITSGITFERVYNYGDTLKDIFGKVGPIKEEEKDEYLKKGYALNDIVGLSYLELYYEDYLKGEKDLYKVNDDNTLTLVQSGKQGNDLVLSIDINVQLELERLIKENIVKAKVRKYTDYFSEAYSIVGHPLTGEIIALAGQKLVSDYHNPLFQNVNTNLINTSYTMGSVVKLASLSTGYKYNALKMGEKMVDSCIKLYQVPLKCSYKPLGTLDDLKAIAKSSNYYQFKIALNLTGNNYKYNMELTTNEEDFERYRKMFRSYGLGSLTNIDLPNEEIGIIGSSLASDLYLNLSIGQYDTYTPIELFQYVNTIASTGVRRAPSLMQEIKNNDKVVVQNEHSILNEVDLDNIYLERLKLAMNTATISGTARNYFYGFSNPAGKTGTAETFIDTNNDGVVDTKTNNLAFIGFAPYDNPQYSIIVLTPHLYIDNGTDFTKTFYTKNISYGITKFLFENA